MIVARVVGGPLNGERIRTCARIPDIIVVLKERRLTLDVDEDVMPVTPGLSRARYRLLGNRYVFNGYVT
jgi:hypothetical protein